MKYEYKKKKKRGSFFSSALPTSAGRYKWNPIVEDFNRIPCVEDPTGFLQWKVTIGFLLWRIPRQKGILL